VFQLNHAIAGKTEPFEHVNIDWNFMLVTTHSNVCDILLVFAASVEGDRHCYFTIMLV